MKPAFDPELKILIDEIDPILKKYDVMAFITVHSKTHGEFRMFFPTWSTCQWEIDSLRRVNLRFKSKKSDGHTHEQTESTIGALLSIRDMCAQVFAWMQDLKSQLDKHMKIEHTRSPIVPHGQD